VARSSPGRSESRITVQIRLSGTVITTATIDLSVQVEFDYGGGGVIP
jgi:hypothetical protein